MLHVVLRQAIIFKGTAILAMWMFGYLVLGQLDVAGNVASRNHYEL